jgi:alpha-glucosidase
MSRLVPIALFLLAGAVAHAGELELISPNQRLAVSINTDGALKYALRFQGKQIVQPSAISMTLLDRQVLGHAPVIIDQKRSTVDASLTPVVRQKSRVVSERYNELRLDFAGDYSVVFRAYDEGFAYRFVTRFATPVTVESEESNIILGSADHLYWPQEKSMQSHNEHYYQYVGFGDIEGKLIGVPALVDSAQGVKIALTETDLQDYPGMYLKGRNSGSLYAVFPKVALEIQAKDDRNVPVVKEADFIAKVEGTRSFPWRILGVAANDADLVTNQLPYLLSAPSTLRDTSWIKPGKVAWDWYNASLLYGVDFKSGLNTQTYKHYIDFAAQYGLEYIIMDEGWYTLGDLLDVNKNIDMQALMDYAKSRRVGIILWVSWKTLDEQMKPALDQFKAWGAAGIKVDFMQRADQWMVNFYERVAKEAAQRKLLVDFHGNYKPSGLSRAYPNVLTYEGVRGLENNKWSDKQTPDHDVTIPFIRMFAGPMDYTPGAMSNAHKKDFVANWDRPVSQGTRSHQLAMYVIYESPLQMLADSPSQYRANPASASFISKIPTTWDESRVLSAKVGEHIAMARKSGDTWYVGAMTGKDGRELALRFDFLGAGNYVAEIMQDGPNADRIAIDVQRKLAKVSKTSTMNIKLANGGGWAAIIRKR